MERSKGKIIIPQELIEILSANAEEKAFFESLTDGYKRGYCDWISGAKQEKTRISRAEKALLMLKNKQKSLRT